MEVEGLDEDPQEALAESSSCTYGDVSRVADVPSPPGFPEAVVVQGNTAYVSAPAGNDPVPVPSTILKYDLNAGELIGQQDITGENLATEHFAAGMAFDSAGRLYVVSFQHGILRLNLSTGTQEVYATIPQLAPCRTPGQTNCSPTRIDRPAHPNEIRFTQDGNLYVTDSWQATIWRVPPGGGTAQAWFQDARLDTAFYGPNGMAVSADKKKLYIVQTVDNFFVGRIWTLNIKAKPTASDLKVFFENGGDIADGLSLGKSGKIYVAIKNEGASGVKILNANGAVVDFLGNPEGSPNAPFDTPAAIGFEAGGYALVTNHAVFTENPDSMALLRACVNDSELPLAKPTIP